MATRILIMADHSARDTYPLSALKVYLDKELPDAIVLIASFDIWEAVLHGFRPDLLVIQHLHGHRNQSMARFQHNQNGLVVCLPTEGRPNSNSQLKWATESWPPELCDLYLAWNKEVWGNLPKSVNSTVTGFPRLPFYRYPLSELSPEKDDIVSSLSLTQRKPVYTIATSFPSSKFATKGIGFNEADGKDLGVITIPGRESPTQWAKDELAYWEEFKWWIVGEMGKNRDVQWVLKPHPAEDISLISPFTDLLGIKLMLGRPIYDLLKISDRHYTRVGCTTAVEAWLWDIPVLSKGDKHSEEEGAGLDSFYCTTPEQVDAYLEKWFTVSIDNPLELAAQKIVELLEKKKPEVRTPTLAEYQACHYALAQHNLYNKTPQTDRNGQYAKSISVDMVRETVGRVREILNGGFMEGLARI